MSSRRISRQASQSYAPQEEMRDVLKRKAHDLFALCDKEQKGFASKRDMYRLTEELSLSPEQLDQVFESLDKDKNGCLTLEEFTEGLGMFLGIDCPIFQEEEEDVERSRMSPLTSTENEEEENEKFEDFLDQLGAQSVFKDEDYIHHMWEKIRKNDPSMLDNFESFLSKVTQELKNTKNEYSSLENILKNQSSVHEEHVQALYVEMEDQLEAEKELLLKKERTKERKIRDELENELRTKDKELQELILEHTEMEKQLEDLNSLDSETKHENVKLQKERDELEKRLSSSERTLNGMENQLDLLRKRSLEEKRKRAKAAFKVSEDIALEREDLVKQLQQLKQVNKQLLDEKDELVLSTCGTPVSTSDDESVPVVEDIRQKSPKKALNPKVRSRHSQEHSKKDTEVISSVNCISTTTTTSISPDYNPMERVSATYDPLIHPIYVQNSSSVLQENIQTSQTLDAPMSLYSEISKSVEDCEVDDDYFLENNPHFLGLTPKADTVLQNNLNVTPVAKVNNCHATFKKVNDCATSDCSMKKSQNSDVRGQKKDETSQAVGNTLIESKEKMSPERLFKIVFIGDSGVGKTSFIHRFCRDSFKHIFNATVGVDFQVKTVDINGRLIALQLWDTAGQERFRSITQQYYRRADGIVVMYDVTSETSFKNVMNWITHVKENADENVVTMLIGNKIDLCDSDDHRVVKTKHGTRLADEYGSLFYETSARNGDSVNEAMEALSCLLQDKEDEVMEKVLKLQEAIKKKKKCC